jgi:DNA-binding beta-propeller fold protein YncE
MARRDFGAYHVRRSHPSSDPPIRSFPMRRSFAWACALLLTFAGTARAQTPAPPGYHVVRTAAVGGEGGWDYLTVDTAGRRLFVTRGTHVMVLDQDSLRVVGDLPGTSGVHGVAFDYALNRGFTSDGRDSTATVFDLKTLQPTSVVHLGAANPDAILFDPATQRVFTFNGRSASATAVNARSLAVEGQVPVGGKPEAGVADGRGTVYVNIEDKGEIAVIDSRALTVTRRIALPDCEEPSGLALDDAHHRLFSVCGNAKMVVVDAQSGALVAAVPTGPGTDGAAFDARTGTAFSSNGGDGTLTVVRAAGPSGYAAVQTVPTRRGARTIALDPRTGHVYVVTAEFGPAPAPTADNPRPRRTIVPGSFVVIEVAP